MKNEPRRGPGRGVCAMRGLGDNQLKEGFPNPMAFLYTMRDELNDGAKETGRISASDYRQTLGRKYQIPKCQSARIIRLLIRYGMAFQDKWGNLHPNHAQPSKLVENHVELHKEPVCRQNDIPASDAAQKCGSSAGTARPTTVDAASEGQTRPNRRDSVFNGCQQPPTKTRHNEQPRTHVKSLYGGRT